MLQAVLKRITLKVFGIEVIEIETFIPNDPSKFSIDLELFVGIEGFGDATERFDVEVCTPSWLLETLRENPCVIGHGRLLVIGYSYQKIIECIESYIKACKGRDVNDVLRRVGLLGEWESEWEL